jgi:hypothetical protein
VGMLGSVMENGHHFNQAREVEPLVTQRLDGPSEMLNRLKLGTCFVFNSAAVRLR